jgi:hypothetical protein
MCQFRAAALTLAFASWAAIFGSTGNANAANVTSFNPQSIILGLQSAGYKSKLSKSDDGNPLIETAADGNEIRIVLTDCEDHENCQTSEFVGVWDCSGAVEKCKQIAISANSEESPVHFLILNDGKTVASYSYILFDRAGISEALLIKNLTTFSHYNSQFTFAVAKK